MKALILISLASLSLALIGSGECDTYQCANSNYPVSGQDCSYGVQNGDHIDYYVSACKSGQTCQVSSGTGYTQCVTDVKISYPGGKCGKGTGYTCNLDMPTNQGACKSGRCHGAGLGSTCSTTSQCNPEEYCNSKNVCAKVKGSGDKCDKNEDSPCKIGYFCSKESGKCTKTMSKDSGDDCKEDQECLGLNCTKGKCVLIVNSNNPQPCNEDAECQGKGTDGKRYASSCDCGMNTTGQRYCKIFNADFECLEFYAGLKAILKDEPYCQLAAGLDALYACAAYDEIKSVKELDEFIYAGAACLNYAQFIDLPDCVIDTYFAGLKDARADLYDDEYDDYDDAIHGRDDFAAALLLPLIWSLI